MGPGIFFCQPDAKVVTESLVHRAAALCSLCDGSASAAVCRSQLQNWYGDHSGNGGSGGRYDTDLGPMAECGIPAVSEDAK